LLRSTRIVVLLGIAVQIAAFLRTAIIAAALGTSAEVDAYNLGLIAPTFLSTVIGSWLQLSFVGRYAGLAATGKTELAAQYRSRMLMLVFGIAALLAGLCFLLPVPIMGLFVPEDRAGALAASAAALKLSGLILVPTLLSDYLSLVLNSHGRFFAAAMAPLVNAAVSVAGLWLWATLDLSALIWTLLLGSIAQGLVIVVATLLQNLSFPIATSVARDEVRKTVLLGFPLLPAAMFANSIAAIVQFRAASLGEGIVAAYGYASRLHGALAQVLVIGLSTVLLPHFATLWARDEQHEIAILFRRLARCTILIVACVTLGIFLMGESAIKILFQRGAFDASETAHVARLWILITLSLFPFAFGTFISKFCQAVHDGGSVLASAAILFAAAWIVAWCGAELGSEDLVASSIVVAPFAATLFWLTWLARRIPIRPILSDIVAASIRTGFIIIPAALGERLARQYTSSLGDVTDLIVRSLLFVSILTVLLIVTRSHRWFLTRHPGD
jgi:putative peptidoglycan lipid II flippase